jgi:hypothetical protein
LEFSFDFLKSAKLKKGGKAGIRTTKRDVSKLFGIFEKK